MAATRPSSTASYREVAGRPQAGQLILVTAINPTKAGEGKTTTTIGLGDALCRLGKKTAIALREPSLGPCFGQKGGATGGGQAQIVPMADINLHFTGDFHAITTAHNLLAAMLDNHIYWGNALGIDARRVFWPRVLDMNDRALRDTVISLGGVANGFPRQARFDITTASEVMAILCLAARPGRSRAAAGADRRRRDARRQAGHGGRPQGGAARWRPILKDAAKPNLVQTLENNPVLIHGGPFANIAHGCNSVIATRAALALGDYVVTEAGFGADLGAEKFLDIKCRQAGLKPELAVVVATVRALKLHGGADEKALGKEDVGAVERGLPNLLRHVENLRKFGLPVLVGINRFLTDTPAELELIEAQCAVAGAKAYLCEHWAKGGAGAEDLGAAPWSRRSTKARRRSSRSIPTTCRLRKRSRPSPGDLSRLGRGDRRHRRSGASRRWRPRATASCRSASPRRSTASPPIRTCAAPRRATRCRSARCGCPPAQASSWRWRARS